MKTFSDFKKSLKVGTVITSENHLRPEYSGKREIVKVQGNGVWYLFGKDRKKGFTAFPKARDVVVKEKSVTFLDPQTKVPAFTYSFGAI